jgi:hypothetical protein
MTKKTISPEYRLRLIRNRLDEFLEEIKDSEDPSFMTTQVWFLESRFETIDALFDDSQHQASPKSRSNSSTTNRTKRRRQP